MAHSFELRTAADFHRALQVQVAEYQDDDLNSVMAVACALFAWHLVEWIRVEFFSSQELGTFRGDLVAKCPELEFMGNIANGTKHAVLSNKKKAVAHTSKANRSFDQTFDSTFNGGFRIHLQDGTEVPFGPCLETVAEFWDRYFQHQLGVDPEPPPDSSP